MNNTIITASDVNDGNEHDDEELKDRGPLAPEGPPGPIVPGPELPAAPAPDQYAGKPRPKLQIYDAQGSLLIDEPLDPIPGGTSDAVYRLQALRAIKRARLKDIDWVYLNREEAKVIQGLIPELSDLTYFYRTAVYQETVSGSFAGRNHRLSNFLGWAYEWRLDLDKDRPVVYVPLLAAALGSYVQYIPPKDTSRIQGAYNPDDAKARYAGPLRFVRLAFKKAGSTRFSIRVDSVDMKLMLEKYPTPQKMAEEYISFTPRQNAFIASSLAKGGYTLYVQIIPNPLAIGLTGDPKVR